jgi:hypothetical protein
MNIFQLRVYYEYTGPTKDDPFCQEKNDVEITKMLDAFARGLPHYLSDQNAKVSYDPDPNNINTKELTVSIETILDKNVTEAAVKKCIVQCDLLCKFM